MINLDFRSIKANFFDSQAIISRVDKTTRTVLSRFGAYVRTRAKTSIRKRKGWKPSPPGRPPHSHTGLLKNFIFFFYEDNRKSVVIGPAKLNTSPRMGSKTVPQLLEYGGRVSASGQSLFVKDSETQQKKEIKLKGTLNYRPRPFMSPALEAERPRLPQMWKDSIK